MCDGDYLNGGDERWSGAGYDDVSDGYFLNQVWIWNGILMMEKSEHGLKMRLHSLLCHVHNDYVDENATDHYKKKIQTS